MKYLVAGRIYSDFYPAVQYANLLHRIANLIVAVEAVEDDLSNTWISHSPDHPPASPK